MNKKQTVDHILAAVKQGIDEGSQAANERIAALESQLAEAEQERDSAENKMQMFADMNAKAEAREGKLRAALTRIRDERGVRPYDVAREALKAAAERPEESEK